MNNPYSKFEYIITYLGYTLLKSLILFIFLISSHALGNEKVTGSYVGEIEDKYKNTYPVTSNLEISDGGVIKETYEYKYGGKDWNGVFLMESYQIKIC